jgi:hypothetical protein
MYEFPDRPLQLSWYGVKLLYAYEMLGEPEKELLDEHFVEDYIAYEESVIIVLADSFDNAYIKAELIAAEHNFEYPNIYGQTVQKSHIESVDCYLIDDENAVQLQEGVEVYSNLIDSSTGIDREIFKKQIYPASDKIHYMLLNNEFSSM